MKRHSLPAGAFVRARRLRRNAMYAEARLWYALRESLPDAKFRRQVPFGRYIADFASHGARLIIEIDGGQHAATVEFDADRTHLLEGEGYRVLRFWNNDVLQNIDGVLSAIAAALPSPLVGEGGPQGRMRGAWQGRAPARRAGTPHPNPLPQGEREQTSVRSL